MDGCGICKFADEHGCWPPEMRHRSVSHCRDCHQCWRGTRRAHCCVCHETFASNRVADAHWRKGGHVPPLEVERIVRVPCLEGVEWVWAKDAPQDPHVPGQERLQRSRAVLAAV